MPAPKLVILPGSEKHLLRKELAAAFSAVGCNALISDQTLLHDPAYAGRLTELLDGSPSLLFSINGSGLPSLNRTLDICGPANCQIAIWFVDNPWNILSAVREPVWRSLPLFVTDKSFIEPLKANGAQNVSHLPLAASFTHFGPDAEREKAFPPPDALAPFVFVGRSSFPDKDSFFANIALPAEVCRTSEEMLRSGRRPDLNWWEEKLGSRAERFWPGREARRPACGAEELNRLWRAQCLAAAAAAGRDFNAQNGLSGPGLDMFGDERWKDSIPPGVRLRPPVDYYTRLPGIYRKARYNLCLTSLQLPQGLNQRHFDVWAAGGICLSDATPGLGLFPEELARPIRFGSPDEIASVMENIEKKGLRNSLSRDWQNCLKEKHRYEHRVVQVLESLEALR